MTGNWLRRGLVVAGCALLLPISLTAASQSSLGTVRIPFQVTANGEPLAAGTYSVRLSDDPVKPALGQSANAERWVEFVQSGQVKGREVASVVTGPATKQVIKSHPLADGAVKVQALKGNEYLRVWIGDTTGQYLINLRATRPAKGKS